MNKKTNIDKILFIYFIALTIIIIISGKLLGQGYEKAFTTIFFYILLPMSAFLTNLISSLFGKMMKYLFLIIYPLAGVLLPMVVFKGVGYDSLSLYYGLIPGIAGFIIGTYLKMRRNIKINRENKNK
ncbi:MAG: hypothetical protein WAO56_02920 [Miniphocaeibacter sp.]|uniref:hypothetical protein n=1 Tax=Miniphocaeibacter sp. TaxID=3100973 RepID=UPI00184B69A6|nr:hypothetical protein [Gallicola sp.]